MKILFFSAYPPARDGIADYANRLVHSLEFTGHNTAVIAPASDTLSQESNIYRVLSTSIISIKRSLSIIKAYNPDVIHVQYCLSLYGLSSFVIYLVIKRLKRHSAIPVVITLHELQREHERIGMFAKIFYWFFLRVFDGYMIHTQASRKILKKTYRIPNHKIQPIHFPLFNFKDTRHSGSYATEQYNLSGKFVILCFGFIQIDKGIQHLLTALTLLPPSKSKNISVVIAGDVRSRSGIFKHFEKKDVQYKQALHQIVQNHQLENHVLFTGFVPDEHVFSLFDRANLIVIPYEKIEHSSVLGMSLVAQKPIIASNVGGLGETLQTSGILVEPRRPDQLAQAIENIIDNPSQVKKLVTEYRVMNQHSTQEYITRQTIRFYSRLRVKPS